MILQFPLFGIPVSIHWTTIFLFLLFSLDAFFYTRKKLEGGTRLGYIFATVTASFLIMLSIGVHEASHAIVANSLGFKITEAGINGAYAYVSNGLDLSAVEPIKEFLIAAAGPVSNFALALLGVPIIYLLGSSLPETTTRYFAIMNIRLGRMNLWPIFVLDGGRILDSIIRATIGQFAWSEYVPHAVAILFMVFLFTKKKGRFELEQLIEKIP